MKIGCKVFVFLLACVSIRSIHLFPEHIPCALSPLSFVFDYYNIEWLQSIPLWAYRIHVCSNTTELFILWQINCRVFINLSSEYLYACITAHEARVAPCVTRIISCSAIFFSFIATFLLKTYVKYVAIETKCS